ncbi:hypothetical protein KKG90_06240 [Candidatus Bipolaricaulota bacterium]|nr:hypothetical protein [Candidatus Bipolaricaulota bacterium]
MTKTPEHITILIGSPKGIEKSNSARLAKGITTVLESARWTSKWFHTHQVLRSDESWDALLSSMARSDVILLAAPLYVDSLPAPVIETLYRLTQAKNALHRDGPPPKMLAILNCGFVEAQQNYTAQSMVRLFCEGMPFEWSGGISIGAGGAINKRIRSALTLAADALRDDILVPDAVDALTGKPMMPPWLYVFGGNFMWKRQAKANGLDAKRLGDRPYEDLSRRG